MKCICGYEYEYEYTPKTYKKNSLKGDEDFITIIGLFFKKSDYDYYGHKVEVDLLACPKCSTVRLA